MFVTQKYTVSSNCSRVCQQVSVQSVSFKQLCTLATLPITHLPGHLTTVHLFSAACPILNCNNFRCYFMSWWKSHEFGKFIRFVREKLCQQHLSLNKYPSQLNNRTRRTITGTFMATPLPWLPVLCIIAPSLLPRVDTNQSMLY